MAVKKNGTILRNLINWLRNQNTMPGGDGTARRLTVPALVIDDEADHASVNTARDPEADPTTINRRIRELLRSFDRVGFVGYTATPFANIFISSGIEDERLGPDLFPSSFIVNLKAPSDYLGPPAVFGHPGDESAGIPAQAPLPMHVEVEDASAWIPDRHRKDHVPGPMPSSLREAIRLFVLNCAARACRGDERRHNSMLVHATRFVNVQGHVASQVEDEVHGLRNLIELAGPDNRGALEKEIRSIWESRIVDRHAAFRERLGERCPALPTWSEVWGGVGNALRRIQVMRINGGSGDALAYSRKPDGLHVIAIGGDKLSRGLTLEGLSVSYFLRASSMFDTLMQMGRWFGYRPRYADLCRVYTTGHLYNAFREIALAMDELRTDLDYMETLDAKPIDFGLRVRSPSDGLLITARNKIQRGEEVDVRFAGELVQALMISSGSDGQAERNRLATRRLIESLGEPERTVRGQRVAHLLWHDVPVDEVIEFLSEYEAFATPSFYWRCEALRRFIRQQNTVDELVQWTVAVVSRKHGPEVPKLQLGPHTIALINRRRKEESPDDRFETQAVVGRGEEALDLGPDEYQKALDRSRTADEGGRDRVPDRKPVREVRPSERGLLLLYPIRDDRDPDPEMFVPAAAISFPNSRTAQPLAYTVNEVWRQQYGLMDDWDELGELP